jgi:predicted transcriptional regulator
MILREVMILTSIAHAGMTVGEVFQECVNKGVSGLPYRDEQGAVIGRVSMRHVFREKCIPRDVVDGAHLLGDEIPHLELLDIEKCHILSQPVEPFLLTTIPSLNPGSPVIKAVAIMEQYNSSYLFIIDEGVYQGTVTRSGIASLLVKHWESCPVES